MSYIRSVNKLCSSLTFSFQKCYFASNIATGGMSAAKRKQLGKHGSVGGKKLISVEEDPHKLVSYVCGSNIYKEGEDIKLKPDEEYRECLWTVTDELLDENSLPYFIKCRKIENRAKAALRKKKKF